MFKIIPFIKPRPPKPPIPPCLHITDEVANQIEATIGSLWFQYECRADAASLSYRQGSNQYVSGRLPASLYGRPL